MTDPIAQSLLVRINAGCLVGSVIPPQGHDIHRAPTHEVEGLSRFVEFVDPNEIQQEIPK